MTLRLVKPALGAILLAGGAMLGGCHPRPLREAVGTGAMHVSTSEPLRGPIAVAKRLACPEAAGEWTRTAAATDGATCSYASHAGVLDLAFASGPPNDPSAALAPERARLDALMPGSRNATLVVDTASDGRGRRAQVDMPFLHVRDDGARTSVKILGFTVDDADDAAAAPGDGSKLVYVLAGGGAAPGGYHAVGYEARSDATGRLVVASFKLAQGDSINSGRDDSGMDRLLALNAPAAQP